MLYLDLGMHDTSTPALMAQQLHKQARKLPEVVGMKSLKTIATTLGSASQFYPDSAEKNLVVKAAAPMEEIVNTFMADVFPSDATTDLTAVIDAYKMILDNLPPGQTKPVIVIGALLNNKNTPPTQLLI